MTDCNRQPLSFSSLGPRALVADFLGGRLTSDAGALLLREAGEATGLFRALDRAIPDPRDPALIVHDQQALLAQRIIALALGYEDLNDHQALRTDPALQAAAGAVPDEQTPLASPATLCRLENRIDRPTLVRIAAALVDQFLAAHPEPPEHLVLDFDATDDPVHGHQEGRFFHGYYDEYCFLPLYVFCGDELVTAYLRPSKIDAAKHARALLRLLVRRLRQAWPDVKITLRADSGFCRWRLMRWCDSNGVGYVLGLARNVVLERRAADAITEAERRFRRTGQPQRVFDSFAYAATTWDRPRRIIVKAERTAQGPNPRFLVVNVPGDPRELYEDVYCQRGEMENRIKEQQLDLFAGRTSCHRFLSNQFRLLLSAAAYVLVQALRRTALAGTGLARAQVGTIRLRLLKVAARVVVSARRVVFHLASSYPLRELFGSVLERLTARATPGRAGAG
jgi:Transposase DDE domain group 1